MIAQFDVKRVREDMKRRYQSVGVMSGLTFYDWVARMFPKNLSALGEEDRPNRILPVPVLADSDRGGANPQDDQIETSGHEARESTSERRKAKTMADSRGGQEPFDRKAYIKEYMKGYRKKPVICPACGHEFTKLKRAKQ